MEKVYKVVLCCSEKQISLQAVKYLEEKGMEVAFCIIHGNGTGEVAGYCREHGITAFSSEDGFGGDVDNIPQADLLITFSYPKVIKKALIQKAKYAINFHPAPLPEYRGCATTSHGIYYQEEFWGVTCHFLTVEIDAGDIIADLRFPLTRDQFKTGIELSLYSAEKCLELFYEVIDRFVKTGKLEGIRKQRADEGKYFSSKYLQEMKEVHLEDNPEEVERKVRALWYPPFEGAYLLIGGKKFYLIEEEILRQCKALYETK